MHGGFDPEAPCLPFQRRSRRDAYELSGDYGWLLRLWSVVICDEAGLKSNRQSAELFRLAHKHNMRVLLVGDVRQHVSVEAGDSARGRRRCASLRNAIRLSGVFAYPRRKDFVHIDGLLAVHGTRSVCLEHLYLATFKDDETLS